MINISHFAEPVSAAVAGADGPVSAANAPYSPATALIDIRFPTKLARSWQERLTRRENEVVAGLQAGSSFGQIAKELGISPKTASHYAKFARWKGWPGPG